MLYCMLLVHFRQSLFLCPSKFFLSPFISLLHSTLFLPLSPSLPSSLMLHSSQDYLLRTDGPVTLSDIIKIEGRSLTAHHHQQQPPETEATHIHDEGSTSKVARQESKLVLLSTSSSTDLTQGAAPLRGIPVRVKACT